MRGLKADNQREEGFYSTIRGIFVGFRGSSLKDVKRALSGNGYLRS